MKQNTYVSVPPKKANLKSLEVDPVGYLDKHTREPMYTSGEKAIKRVEVTQRESTQQKCEHRTQLLNYIILLVLET